MNATIVEPADFDVSACLGGCHIGHHNDDVKRNKKKTSAARPHNDDARSVHVDTWKRKRIRANEFGDQPSCGRANKKSRETQQTSTTCRGHHMLVRVVS